MKGSRGKNNGGFSNPTKVAIGLCLTLLVFFVYRENHRSSPESTIAVAQSETLMSRLANLESMMKSGQTEDATVPKGNLDAEIQQRLKSAIDEKNEYHRKYTELVKKFSDLEGKLKTLESQPKTAAPQLGEDGKPIGAVFGIEKSCAEYFEENLGYTRYEGAGCPWTVQNYDNWPSMPPLCQYMSIECRVHEGEKFETAQSLLGAGINEPWHMTSHADAMFFEFVLSRHLDVEVVVELGTAGGITSLFFGMATRTRKGRFYTFDVEDHRKPASKNGWLDNMEFTKEDITYPSPQETAVNGLNKKVVKALGSSPKPVILFADNGNKKWEVNNYCTVMRVGDIIITHDWGKEIVLDDVIGTLTANGFETVYFDFAEHIGSEARAFIKKR